MLIWQHALELVKAALAVKPVPVADIIQRKEELLQRALHIAARFRHPAHIKPVEDFYQGPRHGKARQVERHRARLSGRFKRTISKMRLFQNAPAKVDATGGHVQPAHLIIGAGLIESLQKSIKILHAPLLHCHMPGGAFGQMDAGRNDHSGLAQPANGGPKKLGF